VNTIKKIGYDHSDKGFDHTTHVRCNRIMWVNKAQISAMGVKETGTDEQGAGDQGLMFGYAVNETPEMMPLRPSLCRIS
jgi:S-adenosylmethionine synthetase